MGDKLAKYYVVIDSCLHPLSNGLPDILYFSKSLFSKHLGSLLHRAPHPQKVKPFHKSKSCMHVMYTMHLYSKWLSFYADKWENKVES